MVSSAYLLLKNFSHTNSGLALMATVRLKKPSLQGRFFHVLTYAEGLLTECADQFQQEPTVDDVEGSQHDQAQEDQHKECSQPASRDHGYLR